MTKMRVIVNLFGCHITVAAKVTRSNVIYLHSRVVGSGRVLRQVHDTWPLAINAGDTMIASVNDELRECIDTAQANS